MGRPISQLPELELPLRETDQLEISRPRGDGSGQYDSYRVPAAAVSVVQATTSVRGIVELATAQEGIDGEDDERAVTPAVVLAILDDVLANRIIAGSGVTLSFDPTTHSLTIGLV